MNGTIVTCLPSFQEFYSMLSSPSPFLFTLFSLSFLPFLPFFIPFYLHKTYYVPEVAENKTAKVSVLLELTFWWPKTDNE